MGLATPLWTVWTANGVHDPPAFQGDLFFSPCRSFVCGPRAWDFEAGNWTKPMKL